MSSRQPARLRDRDTAQQAQLIRTAFWLYPTALIMLGVLAFWMKQQGWISPLAFNVALVVNGVGIARIIDLVARPLVRSGALLPVLPDEFGTDPVPMFAVMLQERHRLPKVRACIDHLAEWMARA